jgi:hypothetical protein
MEMNLLSYPEIATGNDSAFLNIRVLERGKGWPGLACNYKLLRRLPDIENEPTTYATPVVMLGLSFGAGKRRGSQRRTERQYISYGAPNVERRCGSSYRMTKR